MAEGDLGGDVGQGVARGLAAGARLQDGVARG